MTTTHAPWWQLDALAESSTILDLHYQLSTGFTVEPTSFINCLVGTTRSYIVTGLLLQSTFRYRLWEKFGFQSVKDFCRQILGRSVHYCKKTIQAALVAVELAIAGNNCLPTCQAQAEELAHLLEEPVPGNPHIRIQGQEKALAEAWDKVLESATEKDSPVTASFIRAVVNPEEKQPTFKKVSIDKETHELIESEARKEGIPAAEWLKRLVQQKVAESTTEATDPETESAWQSDLEQIIEEHDNPAEEPIPPTGMRIGDRIVTPNGVATITDFKKAGLATIILADYGSGISHPHHIADVISVVPRPREERSSIAPAPMSAEKLSAFREQLFKSP